MGRKRNQGRARKAAKAKAEERGDDNNNQRTSERQQALAAQMLQLQIGAAPIPSDTTKCWHGCPKMDKTCTDFILAFQKMFYNEICVAEDISVRLFAAEEAAMNKFADVWNDSAKMESAMAHLLCRGTQYFLDGYYANARDCATFARYFEQHVAVALHQTQALVHWPKIYETYLATSSSNENGYNPSDLHTLVKFYRKRIPCCCLDEKYEEVRSTAKMGMCFNLQCNLPRVERIKTMYCGRCRCATYCSPECQKVHWSTHKPICDKAAAVKANFEAKQQNHEMRVISPSPGKLGRLQKR